ncbi:type II toxin-antitoxin system VapC family toxin [[Phormidium] sp. ETS-05]|uniref:type II toxin-antitoxin system VapC family toxin n=1 Tax=[Phormidium] sp. ETS-05 TaxID=222819 RepID=UPI0018EF1282|nr:type II toxin-antitoxin system VapC family toxin [[Phormidium] sp. ETS-05]
MRAVIADTGPLYAAFDVSDQYHNRAQVELQQLERERLQVIIPYPVVWEAYSLIMQRLGPVLALQFLDSLQLGAQFFNPTLDDYQAAIELVGLYPDQRITLFDALTGVISQRLRYPVWTYDYHFDVMGIPVWR